MKNGLDVDVRYQNTLELSNELIGMFASSSDIDVIYVGAGYDTGGDIELDADHFDHFHVRYNDPD